MGVPITFLDNYSPDQFTILNANDYRLGDTAAKPHGLIKDKDATITTAAVSINQSRRAQRMLASSSDVLSPGADGWHINGQKKYARIFIQRYGVSPGI
jgi:hypothetical protein